VYEFDPPERFVAGTVGPPGQRTFFLQARSGRRILSVSCEKQQVAALADRLNDLLDAYGGGAASEQAAAPYLDDGPLDAPIEDEFRALALALAWDPQDEVIVVEAHSTTAQLDDPEDEAGEADDGDTAGDETGQGGTPHSTERGAPRDAGIAAVDPAPGKPDDILAKPPEATDPTGDVDSGLPEDDEVLRVRVSPGRARAFARRCSLVVSAGRPACPFCGGPLDAVGHICPRANGYKR